MKVVNVRLRLRPRLTQHSYMYMNIIEACHLLCLGSLDWSPVHLGVLCFERYMSVCSAPPYPPDHDDAIVAEYKLDRQLSMK